MKATIDAAGRVVIPKALRERAGLLAGTEVDFRFVDGAVEISVASDHAEWEHVGRVRYPVVPGPGLTTSEIADLVGEGRHDRLEALDHVGH